MRAETLNKLPKILYESQKRLYLFHGSWLWTLAKAFYLGVGALQSFRCDVKAKERGAGVEEITLLELAVEPMLT